MKKTLITLILLTLFCTQIERNNPFDPESQAWSIPYVTIMNDTAVSIRDSFVVHAVGADSDGTIKKFIWGVNGVFKDTLDANAITVAFHDSGSAIVCVKAMDDAGLVSKADTCRVRVRLDAPVVTVMNSGSVNVNDTVEITAAATDNGTVIKYAWALDSTHYADTTTAGWIKVAFADSGAHTVNVKVVDDDSVWSTPAKVVITATLGAPIVTAMNNTSLCINDSITITATATDNGTIRKYYWALNGMDFKDSTTAAQIKTAYADSGIYTVKVKVIDDDGILSTPSTVVLTVCKDAPAASISGNSTVAINTPMSFTAQTSQKYGCIVKYRWDNGASAGYDDSTGSTYTFAFQAESTFTLRLAVTDDDGNVTVATKTIVVTNDAPDISALKDTTISINDVVTFMVSATDSSGIQKYIWDFDDGSAHEHDTTTSASIAHQFPATPKVCTTSVVAFDRFGKTSTTSAFATVVLDAPVVRAGRDTTVGIKDVINLCGSATDAFGSIVSLAWDIGNTGNFIATLRLDTNIIAPPIENLNYQCVFKATDDDGNEQVNTMVVVVEKRPPTANAGQDTLVFVNEQVRLHGSASFDETSIVQFAWKCGNDNWLVVSNGDTIVTAPSTELNWVCSLKVVDDDGNISFANTKVDVIFQPTDFDGNKYDVVRIGTQFWTVQNLRTTKYNDGTAIPLVTSDAEWANMNTDAYSFYDNATDSAYQKKWGALYNWYAVITEKLAPAGWHIPTDAEWTTLSNYLGGDAVAGKKLKATSGWYSGGNGTDDYNFSALPCGFRNYDGSYSYQGHYGYWWSATADDASRAWGRGLGHDRENLDRGSSHKQDGFSVRLLRDN
jgi:uncharacterized protein (TIGR02145 family)